MTYVSDRSPYKSRSVYVPRDLTGYLYFHPNNYESKFDEHGDHYLAIQTGDYPYLTEGELKQDQDEGTIFSVTKDGEYTYSDWDGKKKFADNYFGNWTDGGFKNFVDVWVFHKISKSLITRLTCPASRLGEKIPSRSLQRMSTM